MSYQEDPLNGVVLHVHECVNKINTIYRMLYLPLWSAKVLHQAILNRSLKYHNVNS